MPGAGARRVDKGMAEGAGMGALAGGHRLAVGVAGRAAVAVQIDELVEVGKGRQVGGMALGAVLVVVNGDRLVASGQGNAVSVACAVTAGAGLTAAGLAGGNGVTHRIILSFVAVADLAAVLAVLADMDAIDHVKRVMAAAAVEGVANIMDVVGVGGGLVGMAGGAVDVVGAAHGGLDNAVVGRGLMTDLAAITAYRAVFGQDVGLMADGAARLLGAEAIRDLAVGEPLVFIGAAMAGETVAAPDYGNGIRPVAHLGQGWRRAVTVGAGVVVDAFHDGLRVIGIVVMAV